MRMTLQVTMAGSIAVATLTVGAGARAGDPFGVRADDLRYEFSEPYLQRIEGVTASAGNARDVNAVTHMIDPWPRYVRNRRIPANGERMVGAINRYRSGRLQFAPPPIAPIYNTTDLKSQAPTASGASGGGAGSTTTTGP